MTLRVGSLVFATDSGLGILAKSFIANGIITHPYVVRHGHHHTHEEWYPGAPITGNLRADHAKILEFCRSVDVMLFLETPFIFELLPHCKAHGVKTAVCVMYECSPKKWPHEPDLYLCPSLLDFQYYPEGVKYIEGEADRIPTRAFNSMFLPVPVDVPWKLRTKAEVFVHNAGHGGLKGRNGTTELLKAINLLPRNHKAKFIIRSQKPLSLKELDQPLFIPGIDERVRFVGDSVPYDELWNEGQIFIFPERHNGLSLPLQEAYASGMLVMASDRFPNNTYLPREPLIPVASYTTTNISPRMNDFQSAIIDPKAIAATIDSWFGRDISEYSLHGKKWAEENSWAVLGPQYKKVLEDLCS